MRNYLRHSPIALVFITLFAGLGCETDQGTTCGTSQLSSGGRVNQKSTHQFYYYPSTQVYRDCQVNRWFWPQGPKLRHGSELPAAIDLGDEIPFVVELQTDDPTKQHSLIVREYPAPDLSGTNASADSTTP